MHTTSATLSAAFANLEHSRLELGKVGVALTAAKAENQSQDKVAYGFSQPFASVFKEYLGNLFSQAWNEHDVAVVVEGHGALEALGGEAVEGVAGFGEDVNVGRGGGGRGGNRE
jgi:hypothetical protein